MGRSLKPINCGDFLVYCPRRVLRCLQNPTFLKFPERRRPSTQGFADRRRNPTEGQESTFMLTRCCFLRLSSFQSITVECGCRRPWPTRTDAVEITSTPTLWTYVRRSPLLLSRFHTPWRVGGGGGKKQKNNCVPGLQDASRVHRRSGSAQVQHGRLLADDLGAERRRYRDDHQPAGEGTREWLADPVQSQLANSGSSLDHGT